MREHLHPILTPDAVKALNWVFRAIELDGTSDTPLPSGEARDVYQYITRKVTKKRDREIEEIVDNLTPLVKNDDKVSFIKKRLYISQRANPGRPSQETLKSLEDEWEQLHGEPKSRPIEQEMELDTAPQKSSNTRKRSESPDSMEVTSEGMKGTSEGRAATGGREIIRALAATARADEPPTRKKAKAASDQPSELAYRAK